LLVRERQEVQEVPRRLSAARDPHQAAAVVPIVSGT